MLTPGPFLVAGVRHASSDAGADFFIHVILYFAPASAFSVRFNLLTPEGSRVRQQYVSESAGAAVERSSMTKRLWFEGDKFVVSEGDHNYPRTKNGFATVGMVEAQCANATGWFSPIIFLTPQISAM